MMRDADAQSASLDLVHADFVDNISCPAPYQARDCNCTSQCGRLSGPAFQKCDTFLEGAAIGVIEPHSIAIADLFRRRKIFSTTPAPDAPADLSPRPSCLSFPAAIRDDAVSLPGAFLERRFAEPDLGRGHLQERDELLAVGAQRVRFKIAQVADLHRRLQPLDGGIRRSGS